MHPALQIIDIIDIIVEHLNNDRKSLARLARVCSLYCKPCTASLWADLTGVGLDPLMAYLPENENARGSTSLFPEDWDPFLRRAALVRTVMVTVLPQADTTVLRAWADHKNVDLAWLQTPFSSKSVSTPVLFPRLRSLLLAVETDCALQRARILLSPSLASLAISGRLNVTSAALLAFLYLLPERTPYLKSMRIEAPCLKTAGAQLCFAPVLGCQELRDVQLHFNAGSNVIKALGTVGIQKLAMSVHGSEDIEHIFRGLPAVRFEDLRFLRLTGDIQRCADVLHSISLPALEEVRFHINYLRSDESVAHFSHGVARAFASLRVLKIRSMANTWRRARVTERIRPAEFAPLLKCARLVDLSFLGGWKGHDLLLWRDDDVAQIADSCRSLQKLNLMSAPWHRYHFHPLLSLNGLLPLAHHCRSLRRLFLAVDMSAFKWPSMPCQPAPHLEVLYLDTCSVAPSREDEDLVIAFIAAIWPNVRLRVDPDSQNTPGNLEVFCDAFTTRRILDNTASFGALSRISPSRSISTG